LVVEVLPGGKKATPPVILEKVPDTKDLYCFNFPRGDHLVEVTGTTMVENEVICKQFGVKVIDEDSEFKERLAYFFATCDYTLKSPGQHLTSVCSLEEHVKFIRDQIKFHNGEILAVCRLKTSDVASFVTYANGVLNKIRQLKCALKCDIKLFKCKKICVARPEVKSCFDTLFCQLLDLTQVGNHFAVIDEKGNQVPKDEPSRWQCAICYGITSGTGQTCFGELI